MFQNTRFYSLYSQNCYFFQITSLHSNTFYKFQKSNVKVTIVARARLAWVAAECEVVAQRVPHYAAVGYAVETVSDKDHLYLPLPAARALILYEAGEESMNFVIQFFVVSSVECYEILLNALGRYLIHYVDDLLKCALLKLS